MYTWQNVSANTSTTHYRKPSLKPIKPFWLHHTVHFLSPSPSSHLPLSLPTFSSSLLLSLLSSPPSNHLPPPSPRHQQLQFRPSLEEVRAKYYRELKKFVCIPLHFRGVGEASSAALTIFPRMIRRNAHGFSVVYKKVCWLCVCVCCVGGGRGEWVGGGGGKRERKRGRK